MKVTEEEYQKIMKIAKREYERYRGQGCKCLSTPPPGEICSNWSTEDFVNEPARSYITKKTKTLQYNVTRKKKLDLENVILSFSNNSKEFKSSAQLFLIPK